MTQRPEAVAFDAIGTLFSLEALRPRLEAAGLPPHALERFIAETLRDAFALAVCGAYRPFREIAAATLDRLMADAPAPRPEKAEGVLNGFSELDAFNDAAPAMRALRERGLRVAILTNGSAKATQSLVDRNGLSDLVERVVSVDDAGRWKPAREPYHACAKALGVAPERLALLAAHGWDVQGARRAGLVTGFVARGGKPFPPVMERPDVEAATLIEAAEALAALPVAS